MRLEEIRKRLEDYERFGSCIMLIHEDISYLLSELDTLQATVTNNLKAYDNMLIVHSAIVREKDAIIESYKKAIEIYDKARLSWLVGKFKR